jgi:hypothetical protein
MLLMPIVLLRVYALFTGWASMQIDHHDALQLISLLGILTIAHHKVISLKHMT